MRKLVSLFAAALLLAACESAPDKQAATGGEGGTQQASSETGMDDGGGDSDGDGAAQADSVETEQMQGPKGGTQEHLVVNVGDRVFFDFDKSNLSNEAEKTVERLAAWLKDYPQTTVTVEGHADERGTREYNLALGARRANSVKDYLIVLGIDPNRIETVSYGEERPAVLGSNEKAWAQNRRAVFVVEQG
jgi:peptidoglycan-associated lipoprotein